MTKQTVAIMITIAASTAFAKVVYLTPTGAGDKDGTSWGNAFATLADAYAAASEHNMKTRR